MPMQLIGGRNDSREFARRSIKNLDFVLSASNSAEVHPVTQTVGMLLGVVVFPFERKAFDGVKTLRLEKATLEGWPKWEMSGPLSDTFKIKSVGDLITQVRHAAAHGDVTFDSDSKRLDEVFVTFENHGESGKQLEWAGRIRADHLANFCRRFAEFVADR